MPVTLKDIAERTGKSIPTVSRALADFPDISLETRRAVQQAAQEMGYEPNTSARNLQKKRTDTLALIIPDTRNLRFSDPFFNEFLSGVVEQAAQFGFSLNISTGAIRDERETYLSHMRRRSADGYIVMRTHRKDTRIDLLREHRVPFVAFGRTELNNDFLLVDEDSAHGIRQAVDHLISLGHSRIACIAEPLTLTKSYQRVQGYLEGLEANNIPFQPELLVETNFRQFSGKTSACQLLDLPVPPTAIVACNDLLAIGAMGEVQGRGLKVGRDVSISGFDDIPLAEFTQPPLTTLHQPAHKFGNLVAELLCKEIKGEPIPERQIIIKPNLILRQSTGPRS